MNVANGLVGEEEISPFQLKAMRIVRAYIDAHLDKSDPPVDFNVYIVWFSKTLQNWKALLSSTLPDQMYYEVTYDGDQKCTYVDAYKKLQNFCVPDERLAEIASGYVAVDRAERTPETPLPGMEGV